MAKVGAPRLAPLALALLAVAPACRAELKLQPALQLRETYTDNVALQPDAAARAEWVSEVAPALAFSDDSRRLKLHGRYQLHYFAYSGHERAGTNNHSHEFNADAHAVLADDFLFLDAGGAVGQQAVSPFGQQVNNNAYAASNRTEIRTWHLAPYAVHQFGTAARATVRYTRDHVASSNVGFGQSGGDTAAVDLQSGTAFRRLGWGLSASRSVIGDTRAGTNSATNATANLRWLVTGTVTLTGTGGYDKYDFSGPGAASKGSFWTVGGVWEPSMRTHVELAGGHRFFGRTWKLDLQHHSRRSVWSIGYNEDVTTTRSQFTLPAAVDTAAMLDKLFMPTIPDPVTRAAAVQAYISASGLPASLTDSVNYLTNRYLLQKQFQASAVFKTARSGFLVNVFDSRRHALSAVEADSELLGGVATNLNDDTRQQGANATWNWQASGRTSMALSLTDTRSKSLAVKRATTNRAARLSLSHTLRRHLVGTVELRHVTGSVATGTEDYHENAVAAALSLQL
jgi:uncharacterized protein (PEP-CTERM system associated)